MVYKITIMILWFQANEIVISSYDWCVSFGIEKERFSGDFWFQLMILMISGKAYMISVLLDSDSYFPD